MRTEVLRTRIAVLWVTVAVAVVFSTVTYFYIPGLIQEAVAGIFEGEEITNGGAMGIALAGAVPLVLAVVSLFLDRRANAVTNLVAGLALGVLFLVLVSGEVLDDGINAHTVLVLLAAALSFVVAGVGAAGLRPVPAG